MDEAPAPAAAGSPARVRGPTLGVGIEQVARDVAGALGANTARAVRSDLRLYAAWCAEAGRRALPASPETVAAFVDAMADVRAPASVRRYLASIALAHRAVGAARPVASTAVQLALKRMYARKGRRQGQALGLTWPLRVRLLEAGGERLIDERNRALLAVAYDAMLRRSELTALQVPDLLEEIGGHGTLLVRRSKTDGEGQGEVVWVGPDSLRLVRRWRRRAGVEDGFLFRSLHKGGQVLGALPLGQVARIFKRMARRAGLPETVVRGLSGHSARIGAAQDMVAAGIELPAILQAGRWKSTAMVNLVDPSLSERQESRGSDIVASCFAPAVRVTSRRRFHHCSAAHRTSSPTNLASAHRTLNQSRRSPASLHPSPGGQLQCWPSGPLRLPTRSLARWQARRSPGRG